LLQGRGEVPETLLKLIESTYQRDIEPDVDDVVALLLIVIKRIPLVTIIIDGLDEALEDRGLLFNILKDILLQATSSRVKLFVSSREDTTYLTTSLGIQNFKIHVAAGAISGDIGNFVHKAVRDLVDVGELVLRDPDLENDICTALTKGAKGM
jgi:hypothetical protein